MNVDEMNKPLSQSVLTQKTEAKLRAVPEERSQGCPAMESHEEARFRRPLGWPLGPVRRRASPHWAKSVFSASFWRIPAAADTVRGVQSVRVAQAITPDIWFDHITGEVPPCPAPHAQATAGYKQASKGQLDARVAGTVSYRPRLQGCQQRQSSPDQRDERQNLKQSIRAPVTRIVSPESSATKWPVGTSSRQLSFTLRNILTGAVAAKIGQAQRHKTSHGTVCSQ